MALTELEQVKMRVGDLQQALETQHPGMLNYLKDIHVALMKNPELSHLLEPEEVAMVIKGLEVKIGETITTPKAKAPKPPRGGSIADFL